MVRRLPAGGAAAASIFVMSGGGDIGAKPGIPAMQTYEALHREEAVPEKKDPSMRTLILYSNQESTVETVR